MKWLRLIKNKIEQESSYKLEKKRILKYLGLKIMLEKRKKKHARRLAQFTLDCMRLMCHISVFLTSIIPRHKCLRHFGMYKILLSSRDNREQDLLPWQLTFPIIG